VAQFVNSAEGGSSGTTVTSVNSGGTSGTAFDSVGLGTGVTLTFDNTQAAHGSLSYKVTTPSTAAASYLVWSSFGTVSQLWFRFYIYLTSNPATSFRVWEAVATGTLCGGIRVNTNGTLYAFDTNDSTIASTTTTNTLALNAWNRVEGYIIGSATVGQIQFSLYKTLDSVTPTETKTSATTVNTASASITQAWQGVAYINASTTLWLDDLGVSSVGYLGPSLVNVSSSDSGSGLDQYWTGGDLGHGAEAQALSLAPQADAGTGAESYVLVAGLLDSDTGSGVEGSAGGNDALYGTGMYGSGIYVPAAYISVSLPDAGSGTESYALTVSLSSSDTGSGAEATQITVAQTDAGAGSDSQSYGASVSSVDSGSGTDSAPYMSVSSVDSGSGVESYVPAAAVSGTDTGAGAESAVLSLILADTGTGSDAGYLGTVTSAGSDTGAGAESAVLSLILADTGTGSDAGYLSTVTSGVDVGTGSDTGQPSTATSAGSDTGTGSDAGYLGSLTSAGTDTGAGSDVGQLSAANSADTGAGSDAGYLGTVTSAGSDAGAGSDTGQLSATASASDAGTGSDAGYLSSLTSAGVDAGTGSDTGYLSSLTSGADTGAGLESLSVRVPGSDVAAGTEAGQVSSVSLAGAETGAGVDVQALHLSSYDSAAGSDVLTSVLAAVVQADAGYAVPGGQQVVTALAADVDAGTGADGGSVSEISLSVTDSGSGWDASVILLGLTDTGSAAEVQAIAHLVGGYDVGRGLDALLAEWGISWGAIDLELQATSTRLHQRADGEAALVLLAEES
jgi:hypothetical protein